MDNQAKTMDKIVALCKTGLSTGSEIRRACQLVGLRLWALS